MVNKNKGKVEVEVPPTPQVKEDKYWFEANPEKLILINNTEKKLTSADFGQCKSGINSFYYDTNNKPLGWLVINNKINNNSHTSNLLNGYVYIEDGRFQISDTRPEKAVFGHQAGPILISNFKFKISNLDDRISDRRSVAIQTEDDKAVFAYFEEATLAELLQKVRELGEKEGFTVKNAINLDGGNSAAYWTGETRVTEAFFSGGFWCESANYEETD